MNNLLLSKIIVIFLGILGFLLALWIRHKKKQQEPMVCPFKGECGQVINSNYSKFLSIDLTYLGMGYYIFIALGYWRSRSCFYNTRYYNFCISIFSIFNRCSGIYS